MYLKLLLILVVGALLLRDDNKVVRSPWVNLDLSELAGGNSVLKEDIELGCTHVSTGSFGR